MTFITFILISIVAIGAILVGAAVIKEFRHAFTVQEGAAGLLYHKGKFIEVLAPGRQVRWGRYHTLIARDLRQASLLVAGQDVLSADNVGLKLSVLVGYRIIDPVKTAHETQDWHSDLYAAAQLALRTVLGGVAVESLLKQRLQIGPQLLERMQAEAARIGVHIVSVDVKDVMFAADLKRAFNEVLKARQEGQAALERARGESAALRNLANAARVLEGNPALMNLRVMQSLSGFQNAGNTLVLGMPGGFVPLNGKRASSSDVKEDTDSEK